MKKIFLVAAVLGVVSLTSCNSEKEKVESKQESVEGKVTDQVEANETMDNVSDAAKNPPTFSSPEANDWAKRFGELADEMQSAAKSNDQAIVADLTKKAVDLSIEQQEISKKISPEDVTKLQEWSLEVQKQLMQ